MERVVPETADMSLALLSLGAITRGWWRGNTPLILGCDDPQADLEGWCFMGAIVGRIANRDSGAAFDLGGKRHGPKANEGPNQLDGGPGGLWNRSWTVEGAGPTEARLSCRSLDGEGDDPGAVEVVLSVTRGTDSLTCGMGTRPDRPTPLTLARHTHYCFGEAADALSLQVHAASVPEIDDALFPPGEILPLSGTPLDLRNGAAPDAVGQRSTVSDFSARRLGNCGCAA